MPEPETFDVPLMGDEWDALTGRITLAAQTAEEQAEAAKEAAKEAAENAAETVVATLESLRDEAASNAALAAGHRTASQANAFAALTAASASAGPYGVVASASALPATGVGTALVALDASTGTYYTRASVAAAWTLLRDPRADTGAAFDAHLLDTDAHGLSALREYLFEQLVVSKVPRVRSDDFTALAALPTAWLAMGSGAHTVSAGALRSTSTQPRYMLTETGEGSQVVEAATATPSEGTGGVLWLLFAHSTSPVTGCAIRLEMVSGVLSVYEGTANVLDTCNIGAVAAGSILRGVLVPQPEGTAVLYVYLDGRLHRTVGIPSTALRGPYAGVRIESYAAVSRIGIWGSYVAASPAPFAVPPVTLATVSTTITDYTTKTDDAALNPPHNQNYNVRIVGGRLTVANTGTATYGYGNQTLSTANHAVRATVGTPGDLTLTLRQSLSGTANRVYVEYLHATTTVRVWQSVAGSTTMLAEYVLPAPLADGQVFGARLVANEITVHAPGLAVVGQVRTTLALTGSTLTGVQITSPATLRSYFSAAFETV